MRHLPWRAGVGSLLALALLCGRPAAVLAQLACGAIVPAGAKVTLTGDIGPCAASAGNPAITLSGGAKLDMGGHKVVCDDGDRPVGIQMEGKGAKLSRGGAQHCSVGLVVAGEGKHKVEDFVATDSSADGVVVASDKNKLRFVAATHNGDDGIDVDGTANKIEDSQAVDNFEDGIVADGGGNKLTRVAGVGNGDGGIDLNGSGNKVKGCTGTGNAEDGVNIDGDDNKVERCLFSHNGTGDDDDAGVEVEGDDNLVGKSILLDNDVRGLLVQPGAGANVRKQNLALGHGEDDLEDGNAGCGSNQWTKNRFGTSAAGGVDDPACIE